MLNRESTAWSQAPIWVKVGLWSINARETALTYEKFSFIAGLIAFAISFFIPAAFYGMALFAAAYWYAVCIRWVDQHQLWTSN